MWNGHVENSSPQAFEYSFKREEYIGFSFMMLVFKICSEDRVQTYFMELYKVLIVYMITRK